MRQHVDQQLLGDSFADDWLSKELPSPGPKQRAPPDAGDQVGGERRDDDQVEGKPRKTRKAQLDSACPQFHVAMIDDLRHLELEAQPVT